MKKLLLIQPTIKDTLDFVHYSNSTLKKIKKYLPKGSRLEKYLKRKKAANIPSLSLMILSALTPREEFEVQLIDEKIEPIDYDCGADFVAITSNTTIINRAYEIATEFRKKGTKVILGGVHASVLPDEALQYSDAIAIGEAEYIWKEILNDFLKGDLKRKYQADRYVNMEYHYIIPDNSILKEEYYLFDTSIELSRGCPHNCSFCSSPIIYGNKYRRRNIEEVISQIGKNKSDYIFFADDNIIGKPKYAKQLLTKLKKLNKRWVGSASILLNKDPELTDLIIESGCKFLIMGLESTSEEALNQIKKGQNIEKDYGRLVRHLQDNGVLIAASFILGFDSDSVQTIKEQSNYAQKEGFLFYIPGVLTPYPGTPLFDQFEREGRLLHKDWSRYNVRNGIPVFSGENHTPRYLEQLKNAVKTNGINYFIREVKKQPEIIEKFTN